MSYSSQGHKRVQLQRNDFEPPEPPSNRVLRKPNAKGRGVYPLLPPTSAPRPKPVAPVPPRQVLPGRLSVDSRKQLLEPCFMSLKAAP